MRYVRTLGLCLIAAVAVAAITAAGAAALPEFGKCEPQAGGKYANSNCTKKAPLGKGSFEWKKGSEIEHVQVVGKNVGSGGVLTTILRACEGPTGNFEGRITRQKCEETGGKQFVDAEALKIECESESNVGEVAGSKEVKALSVKFLGCKLFGSAPCSNGPIEGEVQVNTLKGTLGYINKAEKKAGLLIEPAKKGGEFAKFDCAGIVETVVGVGNKTEGANYTTSGCSLACPGTTPEQEAHGGYDGLISTIGPVNTMATQFTQVFTVNPSTTENVPSKFEGKHIELLEDYVFSPESPESSTQWSPAGEEITNESTDCKLGNKQLSECVQHTVEGEIKA